MLDLSPNFFPLKNHVILKQIETYIRENTSDKNITELFLKNIVFIYPQMISFSFNGYPDDIKEFQFKKGEILDEAHVMLQEGKDVPHSTYNKANIKAFFKTFLDALKSLSFSPYQIIDLRKTKIFDESLINEILNLYQYAKIPVILLCAEDSAIYLQNAAKSICFGDKCQHMHSVESMYEYVRDYIRQPNNLIEIELSDRLTISAFEKQLRDKDFYTIIRSKSLIILNFNRVTKISFFTVSLLNMLIHTICHHYGVVWQLKNDDKKLKAYDYLVNLRTFEINKLFLSQLDYPSKQQESAINRLGTIIFDSSQKDFVQRKVSDFVNGVVGLFPRYFSQYVSIAYKSKNDSHKKQVYRLTRDSFVKRIIFELLENIIIHSKGIGYLAMEVSNYQLKIFIGDCGVGLREGILKNYQIEDKIKNDQMALIHAFNLDPKDKRKAEFPDENAGWGLRDTLSCIFSLRGKFMVRTNKTIGSFVNTIRSPYPTAILDSYLNMQGTHFMIVIPIYDIFDSQLPGTTDAFLNMED